MLTEAEIAPKRSMPLLRAQYHLLGEQGVYEGRRVQLLYGRVIDMSPMGPLHRDVIRVLTRVFVGLLPPEYDVMVQLPVVVSDESEPEPDFSFVPRYDGQPSQEVLHPLLAVEVADSSRKLDLGPKARLYAEAQIPEYWVIDLGRSSTVVHRAVRRQRYTKVTRVSWSTQLASSAIPAISLKLSEALHGLRRG